jgi:transcriptional activator of eps genes
VLCCAHETFQLWLALSEERFKLGLYCYSFHNIKKDGVVFQLLIERSHWGSDPMRGIVGNQEKKRLVSADELDAYLASYVGMLGNASAPIWLCDVSPLANDTPLVAPLIPWREPAVWDEGFRRRNETQMARWGLHQATARIMASAYTASSDAGVDWKPYFWTRLYAPSGDDFRLSLFPLPSRSGAARCWKESYGDQPALNPQRRYLDLCKLGGRFAFITALRKRMAPKVIVCFGPRHAQDFLNAFGFIGMPSTEFVLQPADQAKHLQIFTEGGTTLVIAPTIGGAMGITSDTLQHALGHYIGKLLRR